ncbi:MAG: nucleotide-binding protein [Anaeroplasmataceae bacterium]|jgi:GGDEF domain-containing protein|nr:nucleotide-binding protein [Anaeroplasmataceae bacterium]
MEKYKPRVFVASSSESLRQARAIIRLLEYETEPTLWTNEVFKSGFSALESLMEIMTQSEFGVFLFTPDDKVLSRHKEEYSVRDNLLFELGLFIGYLGREKAFFITPRSVDIKIPSDLFGITHLEYDDKRRDGNLDAAFEPPVSRILELVYKLRYKVEKIELSKTIVSAAYCGENGKTNEEKDVKKIEKIQYFLQELFHVCNNNDSFDSLIYIDVDKMSNISRIYGKYIGDVIIEKMEIVVTQICEDTIDEFYFKKVYTDSFVIICRYKYLEVLAEKIVRKVKEFEWEKIIDGLYVTVSCGICKRLKQSDDNQEFEEDIVHWVKRGIHGARVSKQRGGNQIYEVLGLSQWAEKLGIEEQISD